uniref:carbonic anhydrase n=1 Tax=Timema bartmani TaxID=61472 RepID=A0A7R9EU52_9NEOP|nr:unnamed protein product [Timema bartmani]
MPSLSQWSGTQVREIKCVEPYRTSSTDIQQLLISPGQGVSASDKRSPAFGYDGPIVRVRVLPRSDELLQNSSLGVSTGAGLFQNVLDAPVLPYPHLKVILPSILSQVYGNDICLERGPKHWAESYQTCSGKYQSPIDIEEHLVSQVRLPPLNFQGFKSKSVSSTLTNNGHTVVLQLNTSDEAILSGGPLKGNYIFAQLHFHWGANDSIGSEDTINNHTFPLELHLVFFKQDYVSFNHALDFKDGLTVLAVFFEVYGDDNDIYSEIVSHLPRVVNPGTNARLKRPVNLDSLLPSIRHLYFTYEGSLTTPPCSEVVTWIDFKQPILLSARQVNAFRKLRSEEGTLTQNFRPVQPLSGRLIHFNVADDLSRSGESSMLRSVPVEALCITAAVLTLQAIYSR